LAMICPQPLAKLRGCAKLKNFIHGRRGVHGLSD
jgi:hypothetical protein